MKINREHLPILTAILFIALLIFFKVPINELLNALFVNPLFSSFQNEWDSDVLLILLLFGIGCWSTKMRFTFLSRLIGFSLLLYILQRRDDYWVFTNMKLIPWLAYWDLLAFSGVFALLFCYLNQSEEEVSSQNKIPYEGFIEDEEVTDEKDDHFKRKTVANQIAGLITSTTNKKSFAIGILGQYGSGKTSFLNLINLALEDKVIKIGFNPWSAASPEIIRNEFFDMLAAKIADSDLKISSLIYSYGRKIGKFDVRSLSAFNWLGFFNHGSSVQYLDEYTRINQMLLELGKKVVITIDDLDRLHPQEIIEVLKLIRNTANFSNVVYLVGYDKGYVESALQSLNSSADGYLDKIFQLEIPLPKREPNDLLIILRSRIESIVSEQHVADFENIMIPNTFRSKYVNAHNGIFRQGRDVVRFLNNFKIAYKLIGDQVDFECLVLLELIKFRFPQIYELIYVRWDTFLYEAPLRATHEQFLSPIIAKKREITKDIDEVSVFKEYLMGLGKWSNEEVNIVDGLFMTLFSGAQYFGPSRKNSISYPLYFEIYFRYRLTSTDLSDKDYQAAKALGKMRKFMGYCASNNLHRELMTRLLQEDISTDRDYFENVISWIFAFGKTFVEKEGMFKFDYQSLIDKLYNYDETIIDRFYRKDPEFYTRFIQDRFSSAPLPFLFENELIYKLKEKDDGFILPISELTNFQLDYFTRYAETDHGLNENVLWIFWGARKYNKVIVDQSGGYQVEWEFEPELVKKMKIYLTKKDPTEFLKFSIESKPFDPSHASIYRQVLNMFDDPNELRKVVEQNQLLKDETKSEYLEFFDELAKVDFKEYVEVDFKSDSLKKEKK